MHPRIFPFVALVLLSPLRPLPACAQDLDSRVDEHRRKLSEQPGRARIRMEPGRTDAIPRMESPRWTGPGMVYVEGLMAPDGATTVRLFRLVADSLGADRRGENDLARMFEAYSGVNNRWDAPGVPGRPGNDHRVASWLTAGYGRNAGAAGDTAAPPDTAGRIVAVYAIQVGAFSVAENAERLTGLLRSKGFGTVVHENLIDGKRLLHLVWVGSYGAPGDAAPDLKKIEELTGLRGVLRERMIWNRW